MTDHRRRHLASWVLAISLLAGCTSGVATTQTSTAPSGTTPPTGSASVTTASATPTPTATDTWNTTQAAAVKTVQGYFEARDQLFDDPSRYSKADATKALEPFVEGDGLKANVTLFVQLRKAGEHYAGPARLAWIAASGVFGSGAGESVNVTVCRDSTGRTLVDRDGKVVAQIKPAIREFEVRNSATGFRITGEKEGLGEPCP